MNLNHKPAKTANRMDLRGRMPHRVALLLAAIVFPLIWLGGLVTTYDAGMAVPDWPGTYGYNMFLYPIETWLFGPFDLLVEHGHRLLASLAGSVAIGLVWVTRRVESRAWVKRFAVGLLLLVILQGALGGFRVLFDARVIAKIHGCVGPAVFTAVVAFCVVTSRWWLQAAFRENRSGQSAIGVGLGRWAGAMLTLCFAQLVLGALIRHVSVDASPASFVMLVALHVTVACLIVLGTVIHWIRTRSSKYRGLGIKFSANAVAVLVLVQFSVGLGTWVVKYGWPAWHADSSFAATYIIGEKSFFQMNLVTLHVAVGSLILGFWMVQTLRCLRLNRVFQRAKAVQHVETAGAQSMQPPSRVQEPVVST